MKDWIVTDAAERDVERAAARYEREAKRGDDFRACVAKAIAELMASPSTSSPLIGDRRGRRRVFVETYPHSVVFEERADAYVVTCVVHNRRAPTVWQRRR